MALTEIQEKKVLVVLLAILAIFIVYRVLTAEEQKRVPLTYKRGAVATSAVRTGHASPGGTIDPLQVFLKKKAEKFPGVKRNIFLMADPKPRPKKKPPMPKAPPPPPVPVKTAMALLGRCSDRVRPPLGAATGATREALTVAIRHAGLRARC